MSTQNTSLSSTESNYVASYCDVIVAVGNVNCYVTSAHQAQLDALEAKLGEGRSEELREVALRRMGLS